MVGANGIACFLTCRQRDSVAAPTMPLTVSSPQILVLIQLSQQLLVNSIPRPCKPRHICTYSTALTSGTFLFYFIFDNS